MQAAITEHCASSGCQIQLPHTLPPLLPPTRPLSICPFPYLSIVSERIQGTKVCSMCFNRKPVSGGFMYINFTNLDSKWSACILLLWWCPFPDKTKKKNHRELWNSLFLGWWSLAECRPRFLEEGPCVAVTRMRSGEQRWGEAPGWGPATRGKVCEQLGLQWAIPRKDQPFRFPCPRGPGLKGRLDVFNIHGLLYQKHHLSRSGFRGVSWGDCFFVNGLSFWRLGPSRGRAPGHLHQLRRQMGNWAVAELAGGCTGGTGERAPSPSVPQAFRARLDPLTQPHFG